MNNTLHFQAGDTGEVHGESLRAQDRGPYRASMFVEAAYNAELRDFLCLPGDLRDAPPAAPSDSVRIKADVQHESPEGPVLEVREDRSWNPAFGAPIPASTGATERRRGVLSAACVAWQCDQLGRMGSIADPYWWIALAALRTQFLNPGIMSLWNSPLSLCWYATLSGDQFVRLIGSDTETNLSFLAEGVTPGNVEAFLWWDDEVRFQLHAHGDRNVTLERSLHGALEPRLAGLVDRIHECLDGVVGAYERTGRIDLTLMDGDVIWGESPDAASDAGSAATAT